MKKRTIKVIIPTLQWDWRTAKIKTDSWGITEVDPFPSYGHDPVLVKKVANQVSKLFPLPFPVHFYLPKFETLDRVNGWTEIRNKWTKKHQNPAPVEKAVIVLSGKRIPIHPAMTRYLVAHEYGHAVEEHLLRVLGKKDHEFRDEYVKLRGLKKQKYYGGGTWHVSSGEVFANDFRIIICGIEQEYWPHQGVPFPSPSKAPKAWKFWKKYL
jgi:hypothetical protein